MPNKPINFILKFLAVSDKLQKPLGSYFLTHSVYDIMKRKCAEMEMFLEGFTHRESYHQYMRL